MGCNIHSYVEVKKGGKWEYVDRLFPATDIDKKVYGKDYIRSTPFKWRSYSVFGFLADVRNYSAVTPITERRDLPDDISVEVKEAAEKWEYDAHSHSWLSLKELLDFNYDQTFENRRVRRQTAPRVWDGGITSEPGEGQIMSYREFLGQAFFSDLEVMKKLGEPENVRVVFWFDD